MKKLILVVLALASVGAQPVQQPTAAQFADLFEYQANIALMYRGFFPERAEYYTGRAEGLRAAAEQIRAELIR